VGVERLDEVATLAQALNPLELGDGAVPSQKDSVEHAAVAALPQVLEMGPLGKGFGAVAAMPLQKPVDSIEGFPSGIFSSLVPTAWPLFES